MKLFEKNKIFFRFYNDCYLVKGHAKGAIFDFQRNRHYEISPLVCEILESLLNEGDIITMQNFPNIKRDNIRTIVKDLEDKELGFITKEPQEFPLTNFEWDRPSLIDNAILELSNSSPFDTEKALNEISKLGCFAIQIRILNVLPKTQLSKLFNFFKKSTFRLVTFYIKHDSHIEYEFLHDRIADNNRFYICLYSCDLNKENYEEYTFSTRIKFIKESLTQSQKDLPIFILNSSEVFCEAQNFNTGLNRKLSISCKGEILNYVSHKQVFGIVGKDNIETIIKSDKFQEKWHINNDSIYKCKDCQYRYVCVFNSDIYSENGFFYKKEDCGYNPYENKWYDKN